jgi:hypothetical protein
LNSRDVARSKVVFNCVGFARIAVVTLFSVTGRQVAEPKTGYGMREFLEAQTKGSRVSRGKEEL